MKRLFLFLTIFSLGFSLIACDSDSEEETSENIDISGVTFLDEEFEYTGEPFSISCKNIPTGVLVTYEGNSVSEVGTHTVVAILKDSKGNELGRLEATITILAAGNNEQTTPVHNHNVCPECGKCLDPNCEGEKCLGHKEPTPTPSERAIEVDYENAYNKAKADFKKKYVYVAKKERN